MTRFLKILALSLAFSGFTSAQYTNVIEDGTTQNVTTDWDNGGAELVVGGSTAGNTLNISDATIVTNSSSLTIGRDSGSERNTVTVEESGLYVDGDTVVGDSGDNNSLNINFRALVENDDAYVGVNSENNAVTVKDFGNWNNDGVLYLNSGTNNSVSVSGGGSVSADSLQLSTNNAFNLNDSGILLLRSSFDASSVGFNWNSGGHLHLTNGTLSGLSTTTNGITYLNDGRDLTLNDSTLNHPVSNDLVIGLDGSGSTLRLLNGATVVNENGRIGSGEDSELNNVIVNGAGSEWRNNGGQLDIGVDAGTGNGLTVSDGGWTYVGDVVQGDLGSGATNGGLAVADTAGATLNLENSAMASISGDVFVGATAGKTGTVNIENESTLSAGTLTIDDGSVVNLKETGTLHVDGDFNYEDNATKLVWENNSTLSVGGVLTKNDGLDGIERTLILNGGDWNLATSDVLSGISNTVSLTSTGSWTTANAVISGTNNTVAVSGSGAHWDNTGGIIANGTNNSITVSTGGKVSADHISITDGNDLNVNSGGTLAISTNLFDWSAQENINWNSGGNIEVIGGTVQGLDTTNLVYNGITNSVTTFGNGRGLTLNDSTLDAGADDLIIGLNQNDESFTISAGSTNVNQNGYIGWGAGSEGNTVTVKDAGSRWENLGGNLNVGAYYKTGETNLTRTGGGDNYLYVRDGAQVFVGDATTNEAGVLVASTTGAKMTIWDGWVEIDDTLFIGQDSLTGTVEIAHEADVRVGDLKIADGSLLDLQADSQFRISTNLNLDAWAGNGFDWESTNSTIQVDGELTRSTYVLDKKQNLILGTKGLWDISGETLIVGVDGDSKLTLLDGAELNALHVELGGSSSNSGASAIIVYDEGTLNATDLTIGGGNDDNYMEVYDQGFVDLLGSLSLGGSNSTGNYIVLDGSNTAMDVALDLTVGGMGSNSADNIFYVQNEAVLNVGGDVSIFGGNEMAFNDGTNTVGGNFTVYSNATVSGAGSVELKDANGLLTFESGNMAIVDGSLTYMVSPGVTFEGIGSNDVNVDGGIFGILGSTSDQFSGFDAINLNDAELYGTGTNDFASVNMANSTIRPTSNLGADTVNGTDTLIDTAGTLFFTGDFTASNTTYKAGVLGAYGNDLLHFDQNVSLEGLIAEVTVSSVTNREIIILTSDVTVEDDFDAIIITNHVLLYDAAITNDGQNIKVVMTNTTDVFSSSLDYAGSESIRAGFNGMKNAVFTRTKQLRRNLVSTAHAMPHDAFLMTNTNAPSGPQGPGADNTIFDMHIWAQYFNGQGEYDAHGNSYGYDLNNSGTSFGADKLIGEDLTLGFNYTYVRGDAQTSNADNLDTETYWLGGYGEWVGESGLYIDAMLAYGRSNYDSVRVETSGDRNYRGTASYRGNNFGGYADVGQYFYYENFSLSPYLGLHTLFINTDDHTETSSIDANEQIKISGMSRNLVESALGLKGRHRFDTGIGRFQTTGYAEWTHDFVQDEIATEMQQINDILGLNSAPITQAAIKPEADIINVGLGLSWRSTEYMEIGIGYNGRFSDDYKEHSASLMLDVMF